MIHFQSIRWKNFLSTGNYFTQIDLQTKISTLIVGSNGSGKSTLLDALCFVLFGKPFRNINKPQLVNAINQKDCLVEIEFETLSKKYKVVRGIKPNVFEIYCDSQLVQQSAAVKDYQEHLEKFILKINYKSFTQIVMLGSTSFTPFMQLSSTDRRAIIEDLLDIQIFSRMNNVLKEKFQLLKEKYSEAKYAFDLKTEKIQMQIQFIENLKKNTESKILQQEHEIANTQIKIEQCSAVEANLQTNLSDLYTQISDKSKIDGKLTKFATIKNNLDKTITKVNSDIEFYDINDECPTCKQGIPHEHKSVIVQERKTKLKEVEDALQKLNDDVDQLVIRQEEIEELVLKIETKKSELTEIQSEISAEKRYIETLKKDIERIRNSKDDLNEENRKLVTLNLELVELEMNMKTLSEERLYYETATNLLKDTGIKTKIIKQYIPVINKLVNKYLSAMNFFVNFHLDESFKETIKSRHRDDFSYASFSEGEKQRIDMALMLTWRAVAKIKNSTNTNLLILDEIFDSSLDTNGTEDLMKILDLLKDSNLFVISHKGDILQDKFSNVVKFEKINNFSRTILK